MKFEHAGRSYTIEFDRYKNSGRLAVVLVSSDGNPFTTLSTNVHSTELADDEFVARTWAENEGLAESCRQFFLDTGRRVSLMGSVRAPVWRIRHPPKFLVLRNGQPVAVFDDAQSAGDYQNRQMVRHNSSWWTVREVPYKP